MNASSSPEELLLIQRQIETFLHVKRMKPTNVTCKSGSTELMINFVVESIAKGVLISIGSLFFSFVYKKVIQMNQDLGSADLIEESKQDYLKMAQVTTNHGENELPEVSIDDELLLLRLIARSTDVKYTLSVTKDDESVNTVTQYEFEITDSQVKKCGKSEYQYFK